MTVSCKRIKIHTLAIHGKTHIFITNHHWQFFPKKHIARSLKRSWYFWNKNTHIFHFSGNSIRYNKIKQGIHIKYKSLLQIDVKTKMRKITCYRVVNIPKKRQYIKGNFIFFNTKSSIKYVWFKCKIIVLHVWVINTKQFYHLFVNWSHNIMSKNRNLRKTFSPQLILTIFHLPRKHVGRSLKRTWYFWHENTHTHFILPVIASNTTKVSNEFILNINYYFKPMWKQSWQIKKDEKNNLLSGYKYTKETTIHQR